MLIPYSQSNAALFIINDLQGVWGKDNFNQKKISMKDIARCEMIMKEFATMMNMKWWISLQDCLKKTILTQRPKPPRNSRKILKESRNHYKEMDQKEDEYFIKALQQRMKNDQN